MSETAVNSTTTSNIPNLTPVNVKAPKGKQLYLFAYIFYALLTSMKVKQNGLLTQAKSLKLNANEQNHLNNLNKKLTFEVPPSGAKLPTDNQVQDKNEETEAIKAQIQNQEITIRQVGQVEMTQASTSESLLQQDGSQDSGWIKMLGQMFQYIDQMTQNI